MMTRKSRVKSHLLNLRFFLFRRFPLTKAVFRFLFLISAFSALFYLLCKTSIPSWLILTEIVLQHPVLRSRRRLYSTMVAGSRPRTEISLAGTFASSAFAACFAELCTIPLDTAKVRLQIQKKAASGAGVVSPKYRGMLGTVATIAREEGAAALWKGIIPGLHRQCLYGGLRIGLYEPVKTFYVGNDFVGDVPLSKKILAALTTGALAITVANPTDLVKVRLQAEGKLSPGVPRRYFGALNAYSTIIRQEGLGALWTGLGPNIARNAIINAAELASYDQVKQTILNIPGFTDNVFTHLLAGLGAGFFAVCIGSPVDVVKSRMMGDSTYKSTLDCFIKTLKNDMSGALAKCRDI
ncbi:PREDICTED: mitochondrial uncoupling protein 1-like isoform X2 [Nelumbo nucifera]|uniref:Mitochondrial uncoupling protein 1-like isoform X2 n=1 Tax=Nelumbo nucifera TaxID=4432 RepID=A0A1U8Q3S4_NELNU|nr:PREDICTED: mitochondrial uncoupling protein 1-like isoform X2 [Nelumbo nucifera]